MFVFGKKNLISSLMGAIICQSALGDLNTIMENPRS